MKLPDTVRPDESSISRQRGDGTDFLLGRIFPIAHMGGLVDGFKDRLFANIRHRGQLAAALNARSRVRLQAAASRAARSRQSQVWIDQQGLNPPLPYGLDGGGA